MPVPFDLREIEMATPVPAVIDLREGDDMALYCEIVGALDRGVGVIVYDPLRMFPGFYVERRHGCYRVTVDRLLNPPAIFADLAAGLRHCFTSRPQP